MTDIKEKLDELMDYIDAYKNDQKASYMQIQFIRQEILQAFESKDKWVDVNERLPLHNEIVSVSDGILVTVAKYDKINAKWVFIAYYGILVSHWMPLPKAPEKP